MRSSARGGRNGAGGTCARIAALALMAAALAGCVSSGIGFVTDSFGGGGGVLSSSANRRVNIIVASTRTEKATVAGVSRPGSARLSASVVTVPPRHAPGVIERPLITPESERRHFTVASRAPLNTDTITAEIASRVAGRFGQGADVLVYVHGFNTDLSEATFRVAQLVTDTGFSGVPVLFTWPSGATLFGYGADREKATSSRDALEKLLSEISRAPGVGRVHILAHSMGTWLAMEALRQNAIAGQADLGGKLGQVMLAAPDLDVDVFKGQIARIGRADNISLFLAADDRALQVSARLAGRSRLGGVDLGDRRMREEIASLGVRIYDLTSISGSDYVRHGTFAEAPEVVRVIGARISEPRVQEGQEAHAPEAQPVAAPATPSTAATSGGSFGAVTSSSLPDIGTSPAPAAPVATTTSPAVEGPPAGVPAGAIAAPVQ